MDNDPHPIMDAIERLLANNPLEDSPVLLALLNWCRSQEMDPDEIPASIATLLGLFIGMRAEDGDDLKVGLKTYTKQIKAAAEVAANRSPLRANSRRSRDRRPRRRLARGSAAHPLWWE